MSEKSKTSMWKKNKVPRGNNHNKTKKKTTVSLYLSKKIVERARFHNLNLSRVAEQALISILDYLEPQNHRSSEFLDRNSFQKEILVDGTGFEPAASAMPTLRSFQADLPAHNILNLTGKLLSIMGKKTIPHFCLLPVYFSHGAK
jgi:hypothetical protein